MTQTVTAGAREGPLRPLTVCARALYAGGRALVTKSQALEPGSWGKNRQRAAVLMLRRKAGSQESGCLSGGAGAHLYFIRGGKADGRKQCQSR